MYKLALGFFIAFLVTSVAAAQCDGGRLGHWGGKARAVAAAGTTIYAVIGSDLVVLDVFNPGQPFEVGRAPLEHPSWALAADATGSRVVAVSGDGLTIIDVSDRRNPRVESTLTGVSGRAVGISGTHAYVGGWLSTFWVVDLADMTHPGIVAELPISSGFRDIAAEGGFVYAGVDSGVFVIDVTDPSAPAVVESLDFEYPAVDALDERLAIAAGGAVHLFDISQGDQPMLLSETPVVGVNLFSDVAVTASYVYVTDGGQVLNTVDIHEPAAPAYVYTAVADSGWGIVRMNDFAVSAAGGKGVRVFGPLSGLVGRFGAASDGANFVVRGGVALYAAGSAGLQILDISDPQTPHLLGELPLSRPYDDAADVAVFGDRAYVANLSSGINIYDIADPAHPFAVGRIAGNPRRLFVRGGNLFAIFHDIDSARTSAVDIFDELDTEPRRISRLEFEFDRRAWDIAVKDGRLAVGRQSGVSIYDVSDPTSPTLISEREMVNSSIRSVAIDERDRAFAITSTGTVSILDVRDGGLVGGFSAGNRSRLSIADDRLYVSGYRSPLLYDISSGYSYDPIRDYPIAPGGGADTSYAQQDDGLLICGTTLEGLVLFQAGGAGDIDRDGVVGLGDLAILLGHFGEAVENGAAEGDLDCDGRVSIDDLLLLLGGWGM